MLDWSSKSLHDVHCLQLGSCNRVTCGCLLHLTGTSCLRATCHCLLVYQHTIKAVCHPGRLTLLHPFCYPRLAAVFVLYSVPSPQPAQQPCGTWHWGLSTCTPQTHLQDVGNRQCCRSSCKHNITDSATAWGLHWRMLSCCAAVSQHWCASAPCSVYKAHSVNGMRRCVCAIHCRDLRLQSPAVLVSIDRIFMIDYQYII